MPIREKNLPPDVLAKVLEHEQKKPKRPRRKPTEMVTPGFLPSPVGSVAIMVAMDTRNELNQRQWQAKNRRAGEAWRRVRESIGWRISRLGPLSEEYESGASLRVKFTRLGGRKLDRSGIAAACKGVEDAIAYILGADDGDPRWRPEWDQEPGGPCGVRVEIEAV